MPRAPAPAAGVPDSAPTQGVEVSDSAEPLRVWVDQDKCTGDGLCVQYAPEVFEFDIDGLAYVKDPGGGLLTAPGARTPVPARLRLEVVDAADRCPGECIHLERARSGSGDPPATGTPPGSGG